MIYNELIPTFDMLNKMAKNGDNPENISKFIDSILPSMKQTLLKHDINECSNCSLFPCKHIAFSGDINASIMLVGESPSEEDEKADRPFSGRSGVLLDNMLNAAAENINERWSRENLFVTNMLKCKVPDGREPHITEIANCKHFLDKEIALVRPKLIICLGTTAANVLIHPSFEILKEHGKLFGDDNMKMIAIHNPNHPLYVGENTEDGINLKTEMWEDLIVANDYLDSLSKE